MQIIVGTGQQQQDEMVSAAPDSTAAAVSKAVSVHAAAENPLSITGSALHCANCSSFTVMLHAAAVGSYSTKMAVN